MLPGGATVGEWLAAKQALLRRVAPAVAEFAVEEYFKTGNELAGPWQLDGASGHPPLAAFLQLLPPSLAALHLQVRQPLLVPAAALLQPFSGLCSLVLQAPSLPADLSPAL